MAKFTKHTFRETEEYEIIEHTIDSETYGEVNYIAYVSKTSDLLINYMTFMDNDIKVKALVNPTFAIEYDMLMDFIGKDSFTEEEMNNINREVYLINEFDKGIVTPYLSVIAIDKLIVPARLEGDKGIRIHFWNEFIQDCFGLALFKRPG